MAKIEKTRIRQYPPRWLAPLHTGFAASSTNLANGTAGRVFLYAFEITVPCLIDSVVFINGNTVAGNITAGVYGPTVTEDTCAGSPVLGQVASTAQVGTNQQQIFPFASPLYAGVGRYYVAVEFSDVTATGFRQATQQQITGHTQYYDRGGGYGTLTDPCPAITNSAAINFSIRIRCTPLVN